MRNKTLFSLLVLCGSTAAIANIAPAQQETPPANETVGEAAPAPDDTVGNETLSNATDVEPSAEPADPTGNGTDADAPPPQ